MPVPLKFTVDPVIVYEFAPGVKVPAIPMVPEDASVKPPEPLLAKLLKLRAGTVCGTVPLKSIVLPENMAT